MPYDELNRLISDFRAITRKNSISPETVGSLLQGLLDTLSKNSVSADQLISINRQLQSMSQNIDDINVKINELLETAPTHEEKYYLKNMTSGEGFAGVLFFHGMLSVNPADITVGKVGHRYIYFNDKTQTFIAVPGKAAPGAPRYFSDWTGSETFGYPSNQGVEPLPQRLYRDVINRKDYWFINGSFEDVTTTP